jgi:hypothetical protein
MPSHVIAVKMRTVNREKRLDNHKTKRYKQPVMGFQQYYTTDHCRSTTAAVTNINHESTTRLVSRFQQLAFNIMVTADAKTNCRHIVKTKS